MKFVGFQSLMNDTKWEEIRLEMDRYEDVDGVITQWRTKYVKDGYICPWSNDWYEYFRLGEYETIEWLEIKVESEEIKNTVVKILKEINVPGEVLSNTIKVYGYIKEGTFIDYI
ncbi:DUF6678 family protein [Bacillus cihuensis]|uniref:DUF6678 family protein n=1 Tax=Bacillus cihuensis TaxID=1208599 RepID=UPI00041D8335|nr:DUF6678 family protein [Bacillus cihuensis]